MSRAPGRSEGEPPSAWVAGSPGVPAAPRARRGGGQRAPTARVREAPIRCSAGTCLSPRKFWSGISFAKRAGFLREGRKPFQRRRLNEVREGGEGLLIHCVLCLRDLWSLGCSSHQDVPVQGFRSFQRQRSKDHALVLTVLGRF